MTDIALLELAAKAARIDTSGWIDGSKKIRVLHPRKPPRISVGYQWNPLTDDGDALRLAVKLGLFNDEDFVAELKAIWMYSCTDYYAATRRAIVRAAAEIGEKQ